MSSVSPQKETDIISKAISLWETGKYVLTNHALQRMKERAVSTADIYDCLLSAQRSEHDDQFRADFNSWTYSLKGYDENQNQIELIIAFDGKLVFISVVRIL